MKHCFENVGSPRDAGVNNPQDFVDDPLRLVDIDLEDSEIGRMTVSGAGKSDVVVEFSCDDIICEFVQMEMFESF